MYPEERQRAIWKRVQETGRVEVTTLALHYEVTPETIRRDLAVLEGRSLVKRVHGGAVSVERTVPERQLDERSHVMAAEKKRIGALAVELLPDSGSVFIDAGSTTAQLAKQIPDDFDLTVITNSVPIALDLAAKPGLTVMTVGGRVRGPTLAEVDDWALRSLAAVRVDTVFIATNAASLQHGLSTPDSAEAAVKRAVFDLADYRILLADHTKFRAESRLQYADLRDVDLIITDTGLPDEDRAELTGAGIEVLEA